jgi:hypothetical protein
MKSPKLTLPVAFTRYLHGTPPYPVLLFAAAVAHQIVGVVIVVAYVVVNDIDIYIYNGHCNRLQVEFVGG